ncbi:hypothetical protein ACQY0O_001758 [Thecaphora frezii]|nr:putative glycosyl hydrolase family 53 protein [Thecaphora frezii]
MLLRHLSLLPLLTGLATAALTYRGVDWSSTSLLESQGTKFYTSSGQQQPLETILATNGVNIVRQRIWVNPADGNYNIDYNLKLAQRAIKAGLKVYLDFHYSDNWADPTKQHPPAAWANLNIDDLTATIYEYTKQSLERFKEANIPIEIVSIGNEIRNGFLWELGRMWRDSNVVAWNTARLLHSASAGVKDAKLPKQPKIMIHVDNGWDSSLQLNWYKRVLAAGTLLATDYDIQGVSFYPFYGKEATLSGLSTSLKALKSKYGKEIQVVETNWPSLCTKPAYEFPADTKGIPISSKGQAEWIETVAKRVEEAGGNGINYWEPFWKSNAGLGSSCEDNTFVDASGKVTVALEAFKRI